MDNHNFEAITVDFETRTRVAGETIHGSVHINHVLAGEDKIEQVLVKLIGRIKTYAIILIHIVVCNSSRISGSFVHQFRHNWQWPVKHDLHGKDLNYRF